MIKLSQRKILQLKEQARFEQKTGFRYIDDRRYAIQSFSSDQWYDVDLELGSCTCPARKTCKHIEYALEVERFRNENRRSN